MDLITNQMLRQAVPLFRVLATFLLILSLSAILVLGKDVFIPLALAVLLSFVLAPLASALQRVGVGRGFSIAGAVAIAALVLGLVGYVAVQQTADLAAQLPTYRLTIHNKIQDVTKKLGGGSGDFSRASSVISDVLVDVQNFGTGTPPPDPSVVVKSEESSGLAKIGSFASPLLHIFGTFAAVFLLAAFILSEREDLRNRLIKLVGTDDLQQTTAAMDDAARRVGRMLLSQLAVNSTFGLAVGIGLWFIGIPSAFLWGVLAGIVRFVPYVGAAIGLLPPLLVAFAFDPGWSAFLWTLGMFAVIEPIVGNGIEPVLYGHSSGLSPLAVVVSATIWAFLWGAVGLVLATPLTICLVVMGRHISRLEFIDILLGDSPPLTPDEMFYQRMLAGDPREAGQHAVKFLQGRALSTYYDEIALVAIRRAHLDIVRHKVDGTRLTTLLNSIQQLIASLDSVRDKPLRRRRLDAETADAFRKVRMDRPGLRRMIAARELGLKWQSATPIAVVFGTHPLDAAAGQMLAQVLTRQGLRSRAISSVEAAQSSKAEADGVALVFLSFVEPLSTLHLRAASRMAHLRCPAAKVVAVIWQDTDANEAAEFAEQWRVDRVVTTTSDALEAAMAFSLAKD